MSISTANSSSHCATTIILFFAIVMVSTIEGISIRQRSSPMCGPHPLLALASATSPYGRFFCKNSVFNQFLIIFIMILGTMGLGNINEVVRAVKENPAVWSDMQLLIRRFDDCIRSSDGLHYKKKRTSAKENVDQGFLLESDPVNFLQ